MISKKTRLIAAMLLLAAAASAVSCGGESSTGNEGKSTDTTDAVTVDPKAGLSEIELRRYMTDTLPEMDYNGREFRISTRDNWEHSEIYTDEESGDILNDALFQRNRTVEERFGVKIVSLPLNVDDQLGVVRSSILGGSDDFDLVSSLCYRTGSLITDGLLYNWLDLPYVDLSSPWWISGINENYRIGDNIFAAVGDMCVSTLTLTYAMYYNRTLGNNYDIDFDTDIAAKIKDGTWTIDYLTEISRIYSDVNGDSVRDVNDIYGFTAESATNLDVYAFSFNIPMIQKGDDGMPALVFNTPKTYEAVEKVNALYWGGEGSFIADADIGYGTSTTVFKNGCALFSTMTLASALGTLRDMQDEYTILPYPKYDEAQEKYMTGAMDQHSVLSMPNTLADPEFASLITEALNMESYKTLFPTYYVEALQNKYARDENTIEMLDVVMQGRNFDLATLFSDQLSGLTWVFRNTVAKKSTDFASAYKSLENGANRAIEKIIKAYQDNIG